LRSLSRDGEGDQFTETEVSTTYNDVHTILEEKLQQNGIQVETHFPEGLSLECRSVQIGQVLLNLLTNSMDAIKDNSEKWIRIEALDLGNFIEISVVDSGSGISEEVAQKLMTPFFTTKTAGHGTGLGLSISRRIL
jgi:C4-dicarboxylate-specific signal transduction histidine kinase